MPKHFKITKRELFYNGNFFVSHFKLFFSVHDVTAFYVYNEAVFKPFFDVIIYYELLDLIEYF